METSGHKNRQRIIPAPTIPNFAEMCTYPNYNTYQSHFAFWAHISSESRKIYNRMNKQQKRNNAQEIQCKKLVLNSL